jgi:hypothetical protein
MFGGGIESLVEANGHTGRCRLNVTMVALERRWDERFYHQTQDIEVHRREAHGGAGKACNYD